MLGAAGLLLFHSADADSPAKLSALAPRAFAATSFGLWCGLVMALRGQFLASALRDRLPGERERAPGAASAPARPSGPTAEQVSQILAQLHLQNAALRVMASSLAAVGERDDQLRNLEREAYEKVIVGLGGEHNRSVVDQLAETARRVDALSVLLTKNTESQDRLAAALTQESQQLLNNHAGRLASEAIELAKVNSSSLVAALKTSVADRLNEVAGDFDIAVAKIHRSAFEQTSQRINDTLEGAVNRAGGLGEKLAAAVEQLTSATSGVENLSSALELGGRRATEAQADYDAALRAAEDALARLAEVLAKPLPEAPGVGLATSLAAVCDVLTEVLGSLRSTLEEVDERRSSLLRARDILAGRFAR